MNTIERLRSQGFSFKKSLGQNFITDTNLLRAIVEDAGIGGDDTAVEIGAGAGTLTSALSKSASRVLAFEIDKSLIPFLESEFKNTPNVEIIARDFLSVKHKELEEMTGCGFKVVANLPYYITAPLIFYFVESVLPVHSLTVMVQSEVAQRLTASPATKEYGSLSLAVQARCDAIITRKAPRNLFTPRPEVDSAVVRMDFIRPFDAFLSRVIKALFAMRRKTALNNISASFSLPKEKALGALESAGLDCAVRGEQLGLCEVKRLADVLRQLI